MKKENPTPVLKKLAKTRGVEKVEELRKIGGETDAKSRFLGLEFKKNETTWILKHEALPYKLTWGDALRFRKNGENMRSPKKTLRKEGGGVKMRKNAIFTVGGPKFGPRVCPSPRFRTRVNVCLSSRFGSRVEVWKHRNSSKNVFYIFLGVGLFKPCRWVERNRLYSLLRGS